MEQSILSYSEWVPINSYKSDIDKLRPKLDNNDQSVIVTLDIKYISLIANIINRVKCLLYVRQRPPPGFLDLSNSILDSCPCLRMGVSILFKWLFSEYPHSLVHYLSLQI